MSWLSDAINNCELTEEVFGYLLGRGVKEETIIEEGFVTWRPQKDLIPDKTFRARHGEHGEYLDGFLITPIWSPRARIIGFEARSIHRKKIFEYRLPEASWNPFWIGLKRAMPKIWAGGDVWVTEGLFDMGPLEWAIPESDAVLASLRAKLSDQHIEFLRRFCKGWVHMVYDRDEAGRKGVEGWVDERSGKRRWGALEKLERKGIPCRDVFYRGGKDPGEIWDKGGVDAIRDAFFL